MADENEDGIMEDMAERMDQVDLVPPDEDPVLPEVLREENGVAEPDERMTIDDLKFPEATVVKIMKEVLPSHAVIAKDAKNLFSRIAAYFVCYATDCSLAHTMKKKHKTIFPDDVLDGLKDNDFEHFVEDLSALLNMRKNGKKNKDKIQQESADTSEISRLEQNTESALNNLIDELEALGDSRNLVVDRNAAEESDVEIVETETANFVEAAEK